MNFYRFFIGLAAIMLLCAHTRAQNPPLTPEQEQKQMMEYVDGEVKRLSSLLNLEYWQEFYVDSTLTHDFAAMGQELKALQKAKVENSDIYIGVRDKWMESIDASYRRIFTEEQWKKYWKSGGAREQKARDKRKK